MSEPDCENTENIAAYAIGGLHEAEAERVHAHLETCQLCADTLEWLRPAVTTLGESVEQLQPPPALRERLMATVNAEAEEARVAPEPRRRPWSATRLHLGRLSFSPATGLAVVLIVIAAAVGYGIGSPGGGAQTETVAVASQVPGSFADLEIKGDSATLQAHGVPQLQDGSVYQVWVQSGNGAPRASSTFRPTGDGNAAAAVPVHGADVVMVTREPSAGSTVPSSAPIYTAKLQNN